MRFIMIHRLTNYREGSVCIKVKHGYVEKFINFCMNDNIYLWGVRHTEDGLIAWLTVEDFFRLRPIVKKSGVKITVVKHFGLPFLMKRWKKRKVMMLGALFFFIGLYMLSSYVWFIDVSGAKSVEHEQILAIAKEYGLERGVRNDSFSSKNIERELLIRIPELAWVGVNTTGTKVSIEVVEKVLPILEEKKSYDLLADKDGIITECIVFQGIPMVKVGDRVKTDDLLIKGADSYHNTIHTDGENSKAKGIVKAKLTYEGYGKVDFSKVLYEKSGEKDFALTMKLGDTVIKLKEVLADSYGAFEKEEITKTFPWWRNSGFTVEFIIDVYEELLVYRQTLSLEQAKQQAVKEALNTSRYLIPEDALLIDNDVKITETEEGIEAKVTFITEEEISKRSNESNDS